MALKYLVGQKIMNEIIRNPANKNKIVEWRVLVVDHLAMRMVSSCCKMHEITSEGISIVEDLRKKREPLPGFDVIYLITASENSVHAFLNDYENLSRPMYRYAHVYFTEAIPDDLFKEISKSEAVKRIKTLKEINIAFLPYESNVFSLDSPETFQCYYNPSYVNAKFANMDRIAEQIATVCSTLNEFPSIRYRLGFDSNVELAQIVMEKLDKYKSEEPTMGEGAEKARSVLLILDRGFDCISPLLHELTFQAMAYDLLPIENDVYTYNLSPSGPKKEVLLDENDDLWVELRHEHIADVSKTVTKNLKKFIDSKKMSTADKASMRDLSQMIKKMPQHQKELNKYSTHLHLAEDCMKAYQTIVSDLCKIEQELATGTTADGEKVKDHSRNLLTTVADPHISPADKIRLIMLYVVSKSGVTEDMLNRLSKAAELATYERETIFNLSHLGLNVSGSKKKFYQIPRRARSNEVVYQVSRWTPIVKDLMEDAIEDKLDLKQYPFMRNRATSVAYHTPTSSRYGQWHKEKQSQNVNKNMPRLIVFIVGGVTYSEMRCAYQVTKNVKNWEVIIGGSHIMTPDNFLTNLGTI